MSDQAPQTNIQEQLKAATRMLRVKRARESLLGFTHLTMPVPEDPDDADRSRYQEAVHHRAIADALEQVERGEILRLIITMPPRHGKSELASKRFPPWFIGRNPSRQVIFSTYAQDFADDFGREWREIIKSSAYRQVFPGVALKKDSQAADRMNVTNNGMFLGGVMVAVGAGGAITGRGADLLLIDDPLKNQEEADSATIREQRWNWFASTAFTRLMPGGAVVIIMTRWHDDDLVGRIFNPEFVDKEEAATWTVLDLPAIKDGKALWPERYPMKALESIRRTVGPRVWSALYQQKPAPEDGLYFKSKDLRTYTAPSELPTNLRIYAASDHAVTEKQERDATVLGCIGVDERDHIWVLPDLVWDRMETDATVEEIVAMMRRRRPMLWWAEDDVIAKSIGPFLRKRMREEKVYTPIFPMKPTKDKKARARSIQGRMQMGMVHFPAFAPWWPEARSELLKFPTAAHDDFVDWLSWTGLGLDSEISASRGADDESNVVQVGSIAWIKASSRARERQEAQKRAAAGF